MGAHVGIPTLFRGVRFRSRTEARWAALFTRLGWPWEYEPIELRGYIPDFVIRFRRPLLVEVKGTSLDEATYLAREKLEASGWEHEALIVGAAPQLLDTGYPILGSHAHREEGPDGELSWLWADGRGFACLNCGSPSVLNCDWSWRCPACEAPSGNDHVGDLRLWDTWAECTNLTQWKGAT